jgi:uncharacterized membrane protein YcfT
MMKMNPARTGTPEQRLDAGQRIDWVDAAKGLSIILVVMMHSTLGLGEMVGKEGWLHTVVAFAKPFRIPAFFMVSGLFMARALQRDWHSYLDKRVVHFAYFYVLWLTIQTIVKIPALYDGSVIAFLGKYILAFVEPFGTLWFIYALAIFSVLTKLLMRWPAPTLILFATLLHIFPPLLSLWGWSLSWSLLREVTTNYIYFVVGYLFASGLFNYAHEAARRISTTLIGLTIWAMISGLFAFGLTDNTHFPTWASLPFVGLGLGILGGFAVIAIASLLVRFGVSRPFQYCGHHSIAIYLAFFIPMVITRLIFVKLDLVKDVGFASLIITVVSVVTPLVIERIVRGTPLAFLFVRPAKYHLSYNTTVHAT